LRFIYIIYKSVIYIQIFCLRILSIFLEMSIIEIQNSYLAKIVLRYYMFDTKHECMQIINQINAFEIINNTLYDNYLRVCDNFCVTLLKLNLIVLVIYMSFCNYFNS